MHPHAAPNSASLVCRQRSHINLARDRKEDFGLLLTKYVLERVRPSHHSERLQICRSKDGLESFTVNCDRVVVGQVGLVRQAIVLITFVAFQSADLD